MTDASAQPGQHFDSDPVTDEGSSRVRLGNGLVAETYVPLCDLLGEDADLVLTALARARIAAYLLTPRIDVARLFVDAQERGDARAIVTATGARTAVTGDPLDPFDDDATAAEPIDELVADDEFESTSDRFGRPALDLDAAFNELTAGWDVDISAAAKAAAAQQVEDDEAEANRPREFEIAETTPDPVEHYVAPAPPPLPRISAATLRALAVIALGVAALVFGGLLDFDPNLTLLLGVGGILIGAGMLVMRLRPHGDDSDDGAVL